MQNIRGYINRRFQGSEPFQLIVTSAGVAVALIAAGKVIYNREEIKKWLQAAAFKAVRSLPGANQLIQKEQEKLIRKLEEELHGHKDVPRFLSLPSEGLPREKVLELMEHMKSKEDPTWKQGRVSGGIYMGDDEHIEFLTRAYGMFAVSNPLHPDVFPSVRKFEAEVIQMCANILGADEAVCGAMTSGGTESIIMALKAYRDAARAQRPDLAVPEIIADPNCPAQKESPGN